MSRRNSSNTLTTFDGNCGEMPIEEAKDFYYEVIEKPDYLSYALKEIGYENIKKFYPEILVAHIDNFGHESARNIILYIVN